MKKALKNLGILGVIALVGAYAAGTVFLIQAWPKMSLSHNLERYTQGKVKTKVGVCGQEFLSIACSGTIVETGKGRNKSTVTLNTRESILPWFWVVGFVGHKLDIDIDGNGSLQLKTQIKPFHEVKLGKGTISLSKIRPGPLWSTSRASMMMIAELVKQANPEVNGVSLDQAEKGFVMLETLGVKKSFSFQYLHRGGALKTVSVVVDGSVTNAH